jgi:predicted nucleotidyltransferase component of viral defense system
MTVDKGVLNEVAAALGARTDMVEKVLQLLHLLNSLMEHQYLKGKWVLKGGTALNLFGLGFPRLSVDIDLNYIGHADRAAMQQDRPKVERAILAICQREGFRITRSPGDEHAGGKWRLNYPSAVNPTSNLELDLNFMLRIPLWQPQLADSANVGGMQARRVPVLDIHELASGKLAALMARHASRDLYDAHGLLTRAPLDDEKLRLGFVIYGAMNRTDWRTIRRENIAFTTQEFRDELLPVIRHGESIGDVEKWARGIVEDCKEQMKRLLPLREEELAFLTKLNDHGEIDASLLTGDAELASCVVQQPMLLWKAQNVREHKRRQGR